MTNNNYFVSLPDSNAALSQSIRNLGSLAPIGTSEKNRSERKEKLSSSSNQSSNFSYS